MIKVKEQRPYIDDINVCHENMVRHWAEDEETGEIYYLVQVETGVEYSDAVDLWPCRYTYKATDKKVNCEEEEPLEEVSVEDDIDEGD